MDKFKLKLISIFGILSVGVITAYFVISSTPKDNLKLTNNSGVNFDQLQNGAEIFTESNIVGESAIDSAGNQNISSNLTEAFSQSFFNQVQAANVSQQSADDLKKNAGTMSTGVLSDVMKLSPQLKTASDIKDSSLKISSDNSMEFKKQYIKNISDAAKKDFANIGDKNILQIINNVYGKSDSSDAIKSADCYRNAAKDFAKIEVPSDFITLHKKAIVYYLNSEIVYRAMASYTSDLFKGSLALEMVDKILADAEEVQNDFNSISIIK
jgi:hypothetical protein